MKVTFKRESLAQALTLVSNVVPGRPTKPILANANFVAKGTSQFEVIATDLDVGIRCPVPVESIEAPESLCLPVQALLSELREASDEMGTLETSGTAATLKLGRDVFEFIGAESAEYPDVLTMKEEEGTPISAKDLARMIDRTAFAAGQGEGRYAINGVFFAVGSKGIEMVATDGRRLAFARRKGKYKAADGEGVIVPLKVLGELRKACDLLGEKDDVRVATQQRTILFATAKATYSSTLVEGNFPKYQDIIPKDLNKHAKIAKDAFTVALRKANYLTSDETRTVALGFSAGSCVMQSRAPEKGRATVTVDAEYEGEPIRIAFNPQFLLDVAKVLDEDKVVIDMNEAGRPAAIREGSDYTYVMMPVQVKE